MAYKNPEDRREYLRNWRKLNPHKDVEYRRRHYEKHRNYYLARAKRLHAEHPERRPEMWRKWSYDGRLKKKYGISTEQFDEILERQKHCCAICREPFDSTRNRHIDHCHDTSVVRGILCHRCNLAIGLLRNSANIALEAAHYLNKSPAVTTAQPAA